jgi:hypothetical protein
MLVNMPSFETLLIYQKSAMDIMQNLNLRTPPQGEPFLRGSAKPQRNDNPHMNSSP